MGFPLVSGSREFGTDRLISLIRRQWKLAFVNPGRCHVTIKSLSEIGLSYQPGNCESELHRNVAPKNVAPKNKSPGRNGCSVFQDSRKAIWAKFFSGSTLIACIGCFVIV